MSKYEDLVSKLKEIFQIDKPELDFGVYRILNARSTEISDYLENRLKAKVAESLAQAGSANSEHIRHELAEAEKNATSLGVNPEEVPKVQELRKKLTDLTSNSTEHENAVYTHLLTFFSRYYDSGDFISQRRYKGDTYAIPYAGEEVLLHWANKDQYYTKSGENFSNYAFKLDDGRVVRFKLIAADTAKDNRKDNDKERRFSLIKEHTRNLIDDEGNEYEETLLPITEEQNNEGVTELVIRFEYKVYPKGTKQEDLTKQAISTLLGSDIVKTRWLDLSTREPTEKNPHRTLLEKCLTNYTNKNTADYFIHKDLGSFLKRELDFYIKNEVMQLDDVQNAASFAGIEKNLRMIQSLRSIALDLINFLAQLEDFQKKLWLKKKFVISSHYCLTIDHVPEELYSEIVANDAQWEQWRNLGVWSGENGTIKALQEKKYLTVDTSKFDGVFKKKLELSMVDIDNKINGLVIGADNYHGLRLIKEKYNSKVDLIHIDPPYNTFSSGFLYKNSFQHSSWLSMIDSRLQESKSMLAKNYCYQAHIDENEYELMHNLFSDNSFGYISSVIWNKKNPMMGGKGLAVQHEYIIWAANNDDPFPMKNDNVLEMIGYKDKLLEMYGGVTDKSREAFAKWVKGNSKLSGGEKAYQYIEETGRIYRHVAMTWPNPNQAPDKFFIPLIHPVTGEKCALPSRGWSRSPEKMKELIDQNEIVFGSDHTTIPQRKIYLTVDSKKPVPSVIENAAKGKIELDNMGLEFSYCHPTSLYQDILYAGLRGKSDAIILDYFAGSGTTGHATLMLNKFDNGQRKYILIEQGQHIDSVLLPRLQKAVYSLNWKNGVPVDINSGSSHFIKVIKLESYEDALNNLQLIRTQTQQDLLSQLPANAQEDYLMCYMLDIESRDSLLSVNDFKKPFDYKLKVAVDSAGAYEERPVDLVETFNYLIGLRVLHMDYQLEKGFVSITGYLPSGEKTLVLWRDTEKVDYDALNKLCDKLAINPADDEFDVVYINGDHNIPTVLTSLEAEGGMTKILKIRQIEPEFLSSMFSVEEV